MQYEKNSEPGRSELSENEITFAKSLDDALERALRTGDNVTSIWSHLKDEQRARLAADYLAAIDINSRKSCNFENTTQQNPTPQEPQATTEPPANRLAHHNLPLPMQDHGNPIHSKTQTRRAWNRRHQISGRSGWISRTAF